GGSTLPAILRWISFSAAAHSVIFSNVLPLKSARPGRAVRKRFEALDRIGQFGSIDCDEGYAGPVGQDTRGRCRVPVVGYDRLRREKEDVRRDGRTSERSRAGNREI